MEIDELYQQVYGGAPLKSKEFIALYEQNKHLFENVPLSNDGLHNKVMRFVADYAHHLTALEYYAKALPEINKALEMVALVPDFKDKDLLEIDYYRMLVFDRAIANYYLKNFKASKKDLEELVRKYPNERYKNWLSATKTYSMQQIITILWYIVAAVVLVTTFVEKESNILLYNSALYLGAVALIVALLLELVKYLNRKKL